MTYPTLTYSGAITWPEDRSPEQKLDGHITTLERIAHRIEMEAHGLWGNNKRKVALLQIARDIRGWAEHMDNALDEVRAEKADRESRLDELRFALLEKIEP